MEKQILTEIRRIKQMMNLPLLSEQKDELYNLLIKLGREGEDEAEKIEIRNALKKQGFSDVEIRSIAAGGEDILNNAVRRLEQKVATQGLGELEEILIKQGISRDAIASLPDGAYFIDGVEGLYMRKKNGLLTDEQYQTKLNDVINALSDVANEAELKRAIKSIELDVDKKISKKIESETIPTERPLTRNEIIENPELNKTLEDILGPDLTKQAKDEFVKVPDETLIQQYNQYLSGELMSPELVERWKKVLTKNPTLKEKWKNLKTWQKIVWVLTAWFGAGATLAIIKNKGFGQILQIIKGPFNLVDTYTKNPEEQQAIKTQEELSNYVQKISNYGVYDKKTNKFVVDLETFIEAEGTVENQIKTLIPEAIKNYYELNKANLNSAFVYEFMEKISEEKIQPVIENVEELIGKFVVKAFEDKDPNRPKDVKRTLTDLVSKFREKFDTEYKKGVLKLNPKAEEKQKRDWEQPKPKYPDNF
jgi:hypothetical protein